MPRFRRYRVFLVSAVIILILLFHVAKNSSWEPSAPLPHTPAKGAGNKETNIRPPKYQQPPPDKAKPDGPAPYRGTPTPDEAQQPPKKEQPIEIPVLKEENGYKDYALPPVTSVKTSTSWAGGNATKTPPPTPRPVATGSRTDVVDDDESLLAGPHKPPGKLEHAATPAPTPTTIHWQKQPEFFPVPPASLIKLPTGKPKPIPPIQARFASPEPAAAREQRERRLARVKAEAERAWRGYKTYAWTHDEVRPVSKTARDPFCGWAATLVDALDTLWIMGLRAEFDEAVAAVAEIDFTTSAYRAEIPVFETVIRYLGGLLAAYDVSAEGPGGPYKILLEKARELAEILMGAFDTPNRMPVLYYGWRPAAASQPRRAATAAGFAELGTLAMEFTRLAQLTGEDRYYDAVARVTDALEDWQRRGTALDGIFPQHVDASGCNRTAMNLRAAEAASAAAREQERLEREAGEADAEPPVGYVPPGGLEGTKSASGGRALGAAAAEPAVDSPQLAQERHGAGGSRGGAPNKRMRRSVETVPDGGNNDTTAAPAQQIPALVGKDTHVSGRSPPPFRADGRTAEWDCPAQGLVPGGYGAESYSMGGSQDSAYEYFPKQYLLLGGLEPKYRALHERAVRAVKKYLLFRPMIPDEDRDLLFSAKANSYDGTDKDLGFEYEVTHLTCFLGGMFALGGKIFESEEDVDVGRRLADGCAWAYEVMPTGIMPEYAMVLPCESAVGCRWNETAWHESLDPNRQWRDEQMADYLERMKEWDSEVRWLQEEAAERKKEADKQAEAAGAVEAEDRSLRPVNDTLPGEDGPKNLPVGTAAAASDETAHDLRSAKDGAASVQKRSAVDGSDSVLERARKATESDEIVTKVGAELDFNSPSSSRPGTGHHDDYHAGDSSSQVSLGDDELTLPPEPVKPQTHEEYVQDRLEREHLPPGFVRLGDKRYILRPEAIESVWYMYRITGDPIWQEKGWRMFESVIAATSVPDGHSAIEDVSSDEPVSFLDNMESFWLAETLKYFYLLFTTPDVVSLDEWVFNTEAHPFRRPT